MVRPAHGVQVVAAHRWSGQRRVPCALLSQALNDEIGVPVRQGVIDLGWTCSSPREPSTYGLRNESGEAMTDDERAEFMLRHDTRRIGTHA